MPAAPERIRYLEAELGDLLRQRAQIERRGGLLAVREAQMRDLEMRVAHLEAELVNCWRDVSMIARVVGILPRRDTRPRRRDVPGRLRETTVPA